MKTVKKKIEIPQGYKAEWVNNILTLVEDKPIVTYKFKVLRNGILLDATFDTEEQAKLACGEGDTVVRIQSSTSSKKSISKHISLPKLPFDSCWIFIVIGALLFLYGLYKFILIDNETATTFSLVKIAAITIIGALITFFCLKGGEE